MFFLPAKSLHFSDVRDCPSMPSLHAHQLEQLLGSLGLGDRDFGQGTLGDLLNKVWSLAGDVRARYARHDVGRGEWGLYCVLLVQV